MTGYGRFKKIVILTAAEIKLENKPKMNAWDAEIATNEQIRAERDSYLQLKTIQDELEAMNVSFDEKTHVWSALNII